MPDILPRQFKDDPEDGREAEPLPLWPVEPVKVHYRWCMDRHEAREAQVAGLPWTCICKGPARDS